MPRGRPANIQARATTAPPHRAWYNGAPPPERATDSVMLTDLLPVVATEVGNAP